MELWEVIGKTLGSDLEGRIRGGRERKKVDREKRGEERRREKEEGE